MYMKLKWSLVTLLIRRHHHHHHRRRRRRHALGLIIYYANGSHIPAQLSCIYN